MDNSFDAFEKYKKRVNIEMTSPLSNFRAGYVYNIISEIEHLKKILSLKSSFGDYGTNPIEKTINDRLTELRAIS